MKVFKAALAAISAGLALYSLYGAVMEIIGTGGVLPMLRFEAFLDRPVKADLFDHFVCAVLFSIFPLWLIFSRNRKRKRARTMP
jgi:hypothetical protein